MMETQFKGMGETLNAKLSLHTLERIILISQVFDHQTEAMDKEIKFLFMNNEMMAITWILMADQLIEQLKQIIFATKMQ